MTTDTGHRAGFEWAGAPDDEQAERGWPILHPAEPCDGVNPQNGRPCNRSYHVGYHRDLSGAEWLDEY